MARESMVPTGNVTRRVVVGTGDRAVEVVVIRVGGPHRPRRGLAVTCLGAVVAIMALVWVGSSLRGSNVSVMSSSLSRGAPFVTPSSTVATTTTAISSTTVDPPADPVGSDGVPVAIESVAPIDASSAGATVAPAIEEPTTTTVAPAPKKRARKRSATTTTVAPAPPVPAPAGNVADLPASEPPPFAAPPDEIAPPAP